MALTKNQQAVARQIGTYRAKALQWRLRLDDDGRYHHYHDLAGAVTETVRAILPNKVDAVIDAAYDYRDQIMIADGYYVDVDRWAS